MDRVEQITIDEMAEATFSCLSKSVPGNALSLVCPADNHLGWLRSC
jgi:hypothetical protein